MTTSTSAVALSYGVWTLLGTAPLDAVLASGSYGAYVQLRESDGAPGADAQAHYVLNASAPFVAIRSGAQVWGKVVGNSPAFTATLEVTTGIEIPGSSGGGGGGGGGAMTIADGANVAQGATTDAAYGGSGPATSISLLKWIGAKLAGTLSVSWSGQSVGVSNFPSSQTVAGSVAITGNPVLGAGSATIGGVNVLNGGAAITSGNPLQVAGAFSASVSATYNLTPPTLTSGSTTGLQVDQNGNLKIAGSFSGSTSVTYNTTPPTLTSGATAPLQGDASGNLKVNIAASSGTLGVSWTGQSVSVSALPSLPTGSNVIGYAGSLNFQTAPVVPTIQAAAYASGNVIGGKQTVSVFRNTTQPSATLSQFLLGWAGTETVAVAVYLFSRNPTNSTITDKAAFVLAAADAQYLACAPFTLTAAASAGSTQTFAAQSLSLSVKNLDSSVTQNLYAVLVVGGAVTPAVGDLFFSISGVLD
jgi:hypothetical protein